MLAGPGEQEMEQQEVQLRWIDVHFVLSPPPHTVRPGAPGLVQCARFAWTPASSAQHSMVAPPPARPHTSAACDASIAHLTLSILTKTGRARKQRSRTSRRSSPKWFAHGGGGTHGALPSGRPESALDR